MSAFLKTSREGAVLTVRMTRPESRNAISDPAQMAEFVQLCDEVRADRTIKAIVLTGEGPAFCAGGNVKDMQKREGMFAGTAYDQRNNYRQGIQIIPTALYEVEVPVIAAVNGAAIGAGLDLACMCDVRIASDKAVFAESFVKLGLVPGDGGAFFLQRIIGPAKATLMSLTGHTIDAATALAWGLVTEVVSADALEDAAQDLAQRIAANPSHALRLTKRLLREAQHMQLDSLLQLSAAFQALAHQTQDHHEAVDAFLGKRAPQFVDA